MYVQMCECCEHPSSMWCAGREERSLPHRWAVCEGEVSDLKEGTTRCSMESRLQSMSAFVVRGAVSTGNAAALWTHRISCGLTHLIVVSWTALCSACMQQRMPLWTLHLYEKMHGNVCMCHAR